MLEGVVSSNKPPLKVIRESLTWQKVHFWTLNGISRSMATPGGPLPRRTPPPPSCEKGPQQRNK